MEILAGRAIEKLKNCDAPTFLTLFFFLSSCTLFNLSASTEIFHLPSILCAGHYHLSSLDTALLLSLIFRLF